MLTEKRILHFRADRDLPSMLQALVRWAAIESEYAHFLLQIGAIYLAKRRVVKDCAMARGDYLRVHLKPKRFALPIERPSELILSETNDYIVAQKPFGLPTHPTLDNGVENLAHYLSPQSSLHPVQRLDQFAAGVIVFAKNPRFAKYFSHQLSRGKINKFYRVLTAQALRPGPLTHFMKPSKTAPREVSVAPAPGWRECRLEIHQIESFNSHFAHHLRLITGRTHQIRAQFAAEGAPLLGDHLYGSQHPSGSIPALAATQIEFTDYEGRTISVKSTKFM